MERNKQVRVYVYEIPHSGLLLGALAAPTESILGSCQSLGLGIVVIGKISDKLGLSTACAARNKLLRPNA